MRGLFVLSRDPDGGDETNEDYINDATWFNVMHHTYVTPLGHDFLPQETAQHHLTHLLPLLRIALTEARVVPVDLACVCYTKGPNMGGLLQVVVATARALLLLWRKPLIAVNHCIAHKMGRAWSMDPIVLYVSSRNT
ncbi:uncharacterized protein LOC133901439 [Phragmites australis]|uniref:uncharacterized protein LOC133901439 n=1 Tax=Phragmites australis TaxID=29695 RepID=UPI002D7959E8|nr:uncharacterized protein LOC133901439 [Phragmites australis]